MGRRHLLPWTALRDNRRIAWETASQAPRSTYGMPRSRPRGIPEARAGGGRGAGARRLVVLAGATEPQEDSLGERPCIPNDILRSLGGAARIA
jgi:hypothetical protein